MFDRAACQATLTFRNRYSTCRAASDQETHLLDPDDSSARAFAVKPAPPARRFIADIDIHNSAAFTRTGQVQTLAVSDMVQLVGVSLTSLTEANLQIVA